ncbi:insulin-like growth factor-binding protein-related protein 1 [Liolophura sinensis]|uniref:insulin-like growth factor-binding protein-related protein 1 n=1 Tax=Liolophura sinensis TaxID=3198878 RepID=UPI003158E403
MMKVIVAALVLFSAGYLVHAQECGTCDKTSCPEPVNCVAGTVLDACECCQQCGLAEGELCDFSPDDHTYGTCGENLECRRRLDNDIEAMCHCSYSEPLCGSDGITYRNLCHLQEVVVLENKDDLKIAAKGPCKTVPKIVSGPEHQKNHTGGNVAISCEAEGYPIPAIDWVFTRANGKAVQLPEDDGKVSLNTRGGPEKYQITGWIQIMKIEKRHEGDYTCVATNKHGTDKAQARVIVLSEDDDRDRDL